MFQASGVLALGHGAVSDCSHIPSVALPGAVTGNASEAIGIENTDATTLKRDEARRLEAFQATADNFSDGADVLCDGLMGFGDVSGCVAMIEEVGCKTRLGALEGDHVDEGDQVVDAAGLDLEHHLAKGRRDLEQAAEDGPGDGEAGEIAFGNRFCVIGAIAHEASNGEGTRLAGGDAVEFDFATVLRDGARREQRRLASKTS